MNEKITIPPNRDWRFKVARWLFPNGIYAMPLQTLHIGDKALVQFGRTPYGWNTVNKEDHDG